MCACVCVLWYLVEEEGSAGGARKSGGDELGAIGQDGITVGAREQARSANVVQEDAAHSDYIIKRRNITFT